MTRKQAKALRDFARWALRGVFEGRDLDGGDVQHEALKLGLLVAVPFDPKRHDGEGAEFCKPGDDWLLLAPMLRGGKRK